MRITLEDSQTTGQQTQTPRPLTDEELKATQKQRFSQMSTREKLHWLRDYYTIPAILTVAVIIFVVLLTKDIRSSKPDGFYAEFINSSLYEIEEWKAEIAEVLSIDPAKEQLTVATAYLSDDNTGQNSDYYAVESIAVRIAAGEIDVIAADEAHFRQYARGGAFMDLRELLSEEEMEAWAPLLVNAQEEVEDGVLGAETPYGLRLKDISGPDSQALYPENDGIIGIVANSKHTERAQTFLRYLLN